MRKFAFFTEGQTEQLYVEALVKFHAAKKNLYIKKDFLLGGRRFEVIRVERESFGDLDTCEYYFLLRDCTSVSRVTSEVRDQYESLVKGKYEAIVGVRDVYPDFEKSDVPRLISSFANVVPHDPISPKLILAVMEIEAWFLADIFHFQTIDHRLSVAYVAKNANIDLNHPVEDRATPAFDLKNIYSLVGLDYNKSKLDVERTLSVLEFEKYAPEVLSRAPSLESLYRFIEEIFI